MERYNITLVGSTISSLIKNGDFKSIKGGKSIVRER